MNDYFDTFIEVNAVATRVLQYGLKQPVTEQNKTDDPIIILMIPGNPGEVEYFKDFMAQINSETNLPVIGVSHAGHNVVPKHLSIPPLNENPDLYSLNGQIAHKKSFIEKYISEKSKLVLIGHSIGCYVILEALHRYPFIKTKVLHSILVFPTIDALGETTNAQKYGVLFGWFKYPLLGLAHVLNCLSESAKQKLMSYFLNAKFPNTPECALKSATNLINPNCLDALIFMGLQEFKTVNELNKEAIGSNEKRLTFLYGEADLWCPVEYYRRIHELYPNCDIRLCLEDMDHAFILDKEETINISKLVVPIIQSVL